MNGKKVKVNLASPAAPQPALLLHPAGGRRGRFSDHRRFDAVVFGQKPGPGSLAPDGARPDVGRDPDGAEGKG